MAELLLTCPKCQSVLDRRNVKYIAVDKCNACGGLWLDKGELVKLNLIGDPFTLHELDRKTGDRKVPPTSLHVKLSCPSCDGKTRVLHIGESLIDQCEQCMGLWLDPGELSAALQALVKSDDEKLVDALIGLS